MTLASPGAPLAMLAGRLERWLKALPGAGDELIERSAPLLDPKQTGWPAWLALRTLGFRWHLHSHFDEDNPSLLFGPRTTARQMLDADVALRLRPAPFEEPVPVPVPLEAATLVLPAPVISRYSPEELGRWAPPGAEREPWRTLLLRLGPAEVLGLWSPARASEPHEVDPRRIRARWTRGGGHLDVEGRGPWPLELLLSLVERLTAPEAIARSDAIAFAALDTNREVWGLARGAVDTALSLQRWLDEAPRRSLGPPRDLLRSRWYVVDQSLRLEALVDADGRLARPDDVGTFLAPFRLEWDTAAARSAPSVVLELPDVVVKGELRTALLEAFREASEIDEVADELNDRLGADLTAEDVLAWCDRASVLRPARDDDDDHYLLVLTADVAGAAVAALVDAERTRLRIDDAGHWSVSLGGTSTGYVGTVAGTELVPGTGAEGFGEFLSTLLRWRVLLP